MVSSLSPRGFWDAPILSNSITAEWREASWIKPFKKLPPYLGLKRDEYKFSIVLPSFTLDYDASAAFFQVFSLPGAFQFSLMRKGWYICRSINRNYHRTEVVTDYNMASSEWLRRCSFALRPLAANENPLMNCYDAIVPTKPPGVSSINTKPPIFNKTTTGTTRPTSVPTTPHKDDGNDYNFLWF